jgi:hypothetical protein
MNLELIILESLKHCDGIPLPKATLVAEVRSRDPRPTLTEIDSALRSLEGDAQVVGVSSKDASGGSKWEITDAGKLRLSKAGL